MAIIITIIIFIIIVPQTGNLVIGDHQHSGKQQHETADDSQWNSNQKAYGAFQLTDTSSASADSSSC